MTLTLMTLTLMTPLMRVEQIILIYSVDNQYVIIQNKERLSLSNGVVGDVIADRKWECRAAFHGRFLSVRASICLNFEPKMG